jgi:hypothetical protein
MMPLQVAQNLSYKKDKNNLKITSSTAACERLRLMRFRGARGMGITIKHITTKEIAVEVKIKRAKWQQFIVY